VENGGEMRGGVQTWNLKIWKLRGFEGRGCEAGAPAWLSGLLGMDHVSWPVHIPKDLRLQVPAPITQWPGTLSAWMSLHEQLWSLSPSVSAQSLSFMFSQQATRMSRGLRVSAGKTEPLTCPAPESPRVVCLGLPGSKQEFLLAPRVQLTESLRSH
jgi:hypothetical protein